MRLVINVTTQQIRIYVRNIYLRNDLKYGCKESLHYFLQDVKGMLLVIFISHKYNETERREYDAVRSDDTKN